VKLDELVYAILRIVVGALFVCHGVQKLFGVFGAEPVHLASQMGVGAVIELVGGALIAVGLFARPAAFLASGQMAVAYFQFHFGWTGWKWLPIVNHGEDAVLFCFVFLLIAARGAGALSLDRLKLRGL
jgi:putative oxidoreductase